MTDRRLHPDPELVDREEPARLCVPVADLLARPDGPRDRQLLYGEDVTILGYQASHALIRAAKDGYHGFVPRDALDEPRKTTHRISAAATHVYAQPDLKSPDRIWLSFGSQVSATGETGKFLETPDGFIPIQHVEPTDRSASDPAKVAEFFLGTPYLWGGNSRAGIDCSGLVQAAFLACRIPCPGDSDLQRKTFGDPMSETAQFLRNDLLFWRGHVAIIRDPDTLIHANAHHMSVTIEPIAETLARIDGQGDGPLLAHKRSGFLGSEVLRKA